MRIGIDARVLDRAITGTGRYLLNVLRELPNVDKQNEYYLFTNSDYSFDKSFFKVISLKLSVLPVKIYSPFWLNFVLPRLLKEYKIDLLFAPNILVPMVRLENTKIVSVVHDVIPRVYEKYYPYLYRMYLSFFLPRSLKKSDKVITVSQHSKDDLLRIYNLDEKKIGIAYNTASNIFKPAYILNLEKANFISELNLPKKYLLYVGVVEKRKNVLGVLKILDILNAKGSDLNLVLVGKPGYGFKNIETEMKRRTGVIRYFSFLDDQLLAYTYNNAFAFLFPSYYEGFGIPPLEAMQCGIPVLSSNTSALVEVVEKGGLMHDPEDYTAFANDILKLENDQSFYNKMKYNALEQAKKFNINETTEKIVHIFNQLLAAKK